MGIKCQIRSTRIYAHERERKEANCHIGVARPYSRTSPAFSQMIPDEKAAADRGAVRASGERRYSEAAARRVHPVMHGTFQGVCAAATNCSGGV